MININEIISDIISELSKNDKNNHVTINKPNKNRSNRKSSHCEDDSCNRMEQIRSSYMNYYKNNSF